MATGVVCETLPHSVNEVNEGSLHFSSDLSSKGPLKQILLNTVISDTRALWSNNKVNWSQSPLAEDPKCPFVQSVCEISDHINYHDNCLCVDGALSSSHREYLHSPVSMTHSS